MAAVSITQVHQLNGHIQIVEDILDYMKMEKKNAKNVGKKICFAIGIILAVMIIRIKNLIVTKLELFYNT